MQGASTSGGVATSQEDGACAVCAGPATFRCSRCKAAKYCSRDCQKADWRTHKAACSVAPAASAPAPAPAPPPGPRAGPPPGQPRPPAGPARPTPHVRQGQQPLPPTQQRHGDGEDAVGTGLAPVPPPGPPPGPPQVPPPGPRPPGSGAPGAGGGRPGPWLRAPGASAPTPTPPPATTAAAAVEQDAGNNADTGSFLTALSGSFSGSQGTGAPPPPRPPPSSQPALSLPQALLPPAAAAAAASEAPTTFLDLPEDVLVLVMQRLPAVSLAACACTCSALSRLASDDALWHRLMGQHGFPLPQTGTLLQAPAEGGAAAGGGPGRMVPQPPSGPRPAYAVAGVQGVRALRAANAGGDATAAAATAAAAAAGNGGSQVPQQGPPQRSFMPGMQAGFFSRGNIGVHAHTHAQAAARGLGVATPPSPHLPRRLKDVFGEYASIDSNLQNSRYAEHNLREHASNVECLSFIDTPLWGRTLVSGAWDGQVRVFALGPRGAGAPPHLVRRYHGHSGWVTSMAAGSSQVITSSTDRRLALWRFASEAPMPYAMMEHPMEVTTVTFAYPGPAPYLPRSQDIVLSGCVDNSVRLIDMARKQILAVLGGHTEVIWGLHAFPTVPILGSHAAVTGSSGGAGSALPVQVMSTSRDGFAKLWNLPALELLPATASASASTSAAAAGATNHAVQLLAGPAVPPAVAAAAPPRPDASPAAATQPLRLACAATLAGHDSAILCSDVFIPPLLHPSTSPYFMAPCPAPVSTESGAAVAAPHAPLRHPRHPPAQLLRWPNAASFQTSGPSGSSTSSASDWELSGPLGATGSADSTVRVWDLARGGACIAVLTGHNNGVLSVKFAVLPTTCASSHPREAPLLPLLADDADGAGGDGVGGRCGHGPGGRGCICPRGSAPATDSSPGPGPGPVSPSPSAAAAAAAGGGGGNNGPGQQHGAAPSVPPRCVCGAALGLPPGCGQRLMLVSGSVRDVRLYDPLRGCWLQTVSIHSGPVTTLCVLRGYIFSLAMNDGFVQYACEGVGDGAVVKPARKPLVPIMCLQDTAHHSFAAAMAVSASGLAVGSGTGDIQYLEFAPRRTQPVRSTHALPPGSPGLRQQQQQQGVGTAGRGSPFILRF